jgi:signal transduction histidine kinase
MAKAKEITLVNNILEEQYVTADIPMLNTIIRNLISNAIKFTPNGGMIEIGTIDQPSEGSIVIYVKDSGMGMSDEIKEKLFKIDSKITNVGTNNEKGTGLGLILCKEFIEKHGGRIWVESEIGKGSTFNFSLPIK